ncbi:hypothetical protein GGR51DRAFT_556751 [Nemania sp. FL0031]|nr:hypothetical protein GGR51DRAFT_556751 [Nemania sp. FL0031]
MLGTKVDDFLHVLNVTLHDSEVSNGSIIGTTHSISPTSEWWFWAMFVALSVTSLLAAIESTATSTAMPAIAEALDSGELYVWFIDAYTLSSQFADIFGRRWITIAVVALFIGREISGSANSPDLLIAGRAI